MKQHILLLEPGYKAKYPPLGLMKIAYFHRTIHGDYVQFAKGRLPASFAPRHWSRIYVTSLFTFEYDATIEAIEYAKSIAEHDTIITVGGIAASLMPEEFEHATGIAPVTGLLNIPGKLGLRDDHLIDQLPLDYSILDQIDYFYPAHDAYFLSATKGCGMRCGFCAVQTLEPNYIPYINIKCQVRRIAEEFGEKSDLLLMDNNVLKSPNFDQIIDDILELGFERGATFMNPKTGKISSRYVDFNQGLDAKLLTEHKARRLGEIALSPARIAFDHIEDERYYVTAIERCAQYGITEMSNYLLYNSEDFTGKGSTYNADVPENLYERMRISLDLQTRLNKNRDQGAHRISIFSFPMRYIPLDATQRGYIGSGWNAKFLRSIQCMLIPTQGKGVGRQSFFFADFGDSAETFVENLSMPERLLSARGFFVECRKDETEEQREARRVLWNENNTLIREWKNLFRNLGDERQSFIAAIGDNEYLPEKLLRLSSPLQQRLYFHYLTNPRALKLLGMVHKGSQTYHNLYNYICESCPTLYNRLVDFLTSSKIQQQFMVRCFVSFFGRAGVRDLLNRLAQRGFDADEILKTWSNAFRRDKTGYFDFDLLRLYRRFLEMGCLSAEERVAACDAILQLEADVLRDILRADFDTFRQAVYAPIEKEYGKKILEQATRALFNQIQFSFFPMMED